MLSGLTLFLSWNVTVRWLHNESYNIIQQQSVWCLLVGVGLMEIITEPEFHSSEDAMAFVKELQLIFQCIGTCDGRMDGEWLILYCCHSAVFSLSI